MCLDAGASVCKYGSWLYVYEIYSFIHVYVHKCIYSCTRTGAGYVYITSGNMSNNSSGSNGSYGNDNDGTGEKCIVFAIVFSVSASVATILFLMFSLTVR